MTIPQSIRKFCKDDYTKIENYKLGRTYHHRRKK